MLEISNIITLYDRLRAADTSCALATVVRVSGSSYRRAGARLLVGTDGQYTGGISGGCLEGDALRRARRAIHRGAPSRHVYDTTEEGDRVIGIGLGCNGQIEVRFVPLDFDDPANQVEVLRSLSGIREPAVAFQDLDDPGGRLLVLGPDPPAPLVPDWVAEVREHRCSTVYEGRFLLEWIRPRLHLIVAGDNYDIPPLARMAADLGWRVTAIGHRRKFTRELAERCPTLLDYRELAVLEVDAFTAVLCMTHDYDRDLDLLRYFLPRRPPYLGLLGPRKRAEKLDAALRAAGSGELLDYPELYAPIGLDIGARTPGEIAAAIVAELIAVFRRSGGRGTHLRERRGSIHDQS